MKKTLTGLLGAGLLAASATAQDISYSTTVGIESKYVFRGAQFGQETFMGSFDLEVDSFYAGIWTAQPTKNRDTWDAEINYYAGFGVDVNDVTGLDFGATLYHFPESSDTSFEPYVGITWDLKFEPSVYIYYDFDLDTFTVEASIGHSWDVADKTTFDLSGSVGWFDPDGGDSGYYFMGYAGFSYAFTDYASGSLGFNLSDLEDGKSHGWAGAHVTVEF